MKNSTDKLIKKMKKAQRLMREVGKDLENDYPKQSYEITGASEIMDSWIEGIAKEK